MAKADLSKFYEPSVAKDLESRLMYRIILSSGIKAKLKQTREYVMELQAVMEIETDLGLDWFDYGFCSRKSGKLAITFYKIIQGKKNITEITIDEADIKEKKYAGILSTLKSVKESLKGNWWN